MGIMEGVDIPLSSITDPGGGLWRFLMVWGILGCVDALSHVTLSTANEGQLVNSSLQGKCWHGCPETRLILATN